LKKRIQNKVFISNKCLTEQGQIYKTFYGCILHMFVFVPGKAFQPSLMFVGSVTRKLNKVFPNF
jgi:hypothetical protein